MTWFWRLIPHTHVTDRTDYGEIEWQTGPRAGTVTNTPSHHCRRCSRWFAFA